MSMRTAIIAATIILLGGAGTVGVFLGVLSHGDRLRPQVETGASGNQSRSVMSLDGTRTTSASGTASEASQQAAAQAGNTATQDQQNQSAQTSTTQVTEPARTAAITTNETQSTQSRSAQSAPLGGETQAPATTQAEKPTTLAALAAQEQPTAKNDGGARAITILQLGDSHTSADFLTGEIRRRLQETYGNGGTGYVTAGKPHIGVLSSTLKIGVSPGWTYKSLQHSEEVGEFWMSGFNTIAKKAGETLSFTSEHPVTFDVIEIEAIRKPDGGAIDIRLDGTLEGSFDLAGDKVEPVVIRLVPDRGPTNKMHEVTLTTRTDGVVSISSVAIYNTRSGLIYNSVGYPGATIDVLNKMDAKLFAADLKRIDPQIVVLSFGTNEASKQNLDMAAYAKKYDRVIGKIRAALPGVTIALIGPPAGEELPSHCKKEARAKAVCRRPTETNASGAHEGADDCEWKALPKLEAVREVERKIAQRNGFLYWNWASIMPKECGAARWLEQSPPLMAKDHIHFTIAGYKKSAAAFIETLRPAIDKLRSRSNAVSNN